MQDEVDACPELTYRAFKHRHEEHRHSDDISVAMEYVEITMQTEENSSVV